MSKIVAKRISSKNIIKTIKKNISAWSLLIPSVFLLYIIYCKPIATGIFLSFFDMRGYEPAGFVGMQNYIDIISDPIFIKTLSNTFSYVVWSLIIGFIPPIIFAIMLNELVHCKSLFKFSLYFPSIIPTVAVSLIWYFMFQPGEGGLLNMLLAKVGIGNFGWLQNPNCTIPLIVLTMTWRGFGSTTIFYLASLQGVNQDLYEAANIDGASIMKKITNITLPQISGIILIFFVQQIIAVFQVMVEPMTMTDGGPSNASMTLGLQGYYYAFRFMKADKALALGVIMFLILMVLTVFYFVAKKKVDEN